MLFTAGKAVVVPSGIVDRILKTFKPVMQYDSKGDLYIAKLTVSRFLRSGVNSLGNANPMC